MFIIYNPAYNWLGFHHLYTLNNGLSGLKNGIALAGCFCSNLSSKPPHKRPPGGAFVGKGRPNLDNCWDFYNFLRIGPTWDENHLLKPPCIRGIYMFFSKHQTTKSKYMLGWFWCSSIVNLVRNVKLLAPSGVCFFPSDSHFVTIKP